jgi:hypothetical protein
VSPEQPELRARTLLRFKDWWIGEHQNNRVIRNIGEERLDGFDKDRLALVDPNSELPFP